MVRGPAINWQHRPDLTVRIGAIYDPVTSKITLTFGSRDVGGTFDVPLPLGYNTSSIHRELIGLIRTLGKGYIPTSIAAPKPKKSRHDVDDDDPERKRRRRRRRITEGGIREYDWDRRRQW